MLSFSKFKKDDPEVKEFAENLVDVMFFTEDDSTMKFGFFNKVDGEVYIYYREIIGEHYALRLEDCYICVINVNWE